ncbi:hypothetical protein ACIBG8_54495 [Nonomuraea sp. NPDC050556]|uniref:hypothetical protein n=1 Tax=Nonomuraea sp. NPDC050556 TaxID=3364369 RepID=UPI0037B57394
MNKAELIALIGPIIVYVLKAMSDRQADRAASAGARAPRPRRSWDDYEDDGGI